MVLRAVRDRRGQSTLEYGLVLLAFMAMICALDAIWRRVSGGSLLDRALGAASHAWGQGGLIALTQDILMF